MIGRVAAVAVAVLAVLGLSQLDDPHAAQPAVASPVVGSAIVPKAPDSTWYCAAGAGDGLDHEVTVTALDHEVTAHVTGYTADSGGAKSADVVVGARSQHVVDVASIAPGLGGVTVEIHGGAALVSHRLSSNSGDDRSTCASAASSSWYFASAATEIVNPATSAESTAHLWLLNPFPTDASVDVRVTYDGTVRVPPKLRGLVVPAGSSRMVDLNATVPRHAQIAATVQARGGRVIAELAQTVPGKGLRLEPGVPATALSWYLPDAFAGDGVSEILHVYNPTSVDATVAVTVYPNGVDKASFPEPFTFDVPARLDVALDLSGQSRLPQSGLRSIRVDVGTGTGVVVAQVDALSGAGGDGTAATRPSVAGGLSSSIGSAAQATTWFLPSLGPAAAGQSVVVIANPSASSIAVVKVSAIAGGTRSTVVKKLEVQPDQSLSVDLGDALAAGAAGVEVSSSSPVVVSGRITSSAEVDVAMFGAVPTLPSASPLPDPS